MNIMELGALGEFVGSIGVIATLVYLAVQISQNNRQIEHNSELVQAGAELDTARIVSDWHGVVVQSNELVEIWSHIVDPSPLTASQRSRLLWLVSQYLFVVEGLYRQHRRGFLSEESWDPYRRALTGLIKLPWVWDFFNSPTSTYSGDFHRLCSELRNSPDQAGWQYTPLEAYGVGNASTAQARGD